MRLSMIIQREVVPKQVMIRYCQPKHLQIRTSDSDLYNGSKTSQTISPGIYL